MAALVFGLFGVMSSQSMGSSSWRSLLADRVCANAAAPTTRSAQRPRLSRRRTLGHQCADEANEDHAMTALPATMTAIAIVGKGGPEVLQPTTIAVPQPERGQVLIKVAAAGVNRPDVMQRLGLYPAPKGHSEIPGLEVSGTVAVAGRRARIASKPATRSWPSSTAAATPSTASPTRAPACRCRTASRMVEAAAIPEGFFTVWHNVFERGGPQEPASGSSCTAARAASALPPSSSPPLSVPR